MELRAKFKPYSLHSAGVTAVMVGLSWGACAAITTVCTLAWSLGFGITWTLVLGILAAFLATLQDLEPWYAAYTAYQAKREKALGPLAPQIQRIDAALLAGKSPAPEDQEQVTTATESLSAEMAQVVSTRRKAVDAITGRLQVEQISAVETDEGIYPAVGDAVMNEIMDDVSTTPAPTQAGFPIGFGGGGPNPKRVVRDAVDELLYNYSEHPHNPQFDDLLATMAVRSIAIDLRIDRSPDLPQASRNILAQLSTIFDNNDLTIDREQVIRQIIGQFASVKFPATTGAVQQSESKAAHDAVRKLFMQPETILFLRGRVAQAQ